MKKKNEFMDTMMEGFDVIPAIEVIIKCKHISTLESLKKVIDKQIEKLKGE